MKIRKLATAFCLAVGLAFAAPSISATIGTGDIMSTVSAATGWEQDDGGVYYLQDDIRLTGWQKLGSYTYYFDESGYRAQGSCTIEDKTYFFGPTNGRLRTGRTGLAASSFEDQVYYYFNEEKDGTIAASQWVTQGNRYYYADETGRIRLGTLQIDGKLYHITKTGRMTSYGRSTYDKKYYYPNKDGSLKTGMQKIDGKWYFFNKQTGIRQTGSIQIGDYYYYFSPSRGYARTGWVGVNDGTGIKKYAYYNTNGRRLSGWQTINNNRYYLNPKKGDVRTTGVARIGTYTYYFNSKGVLQTGFYQLDGKTYYTNSNGVRRKGWQTIGGKRYYFNRKTRVMETGWLTIGKNKYYLNPVSTSSTYGAATVGFANIRNSYYYFDTDGKMHTKWLTIGTKKYYFDPDTGKMYTGVHVIDGKTYDFGANGAYNAEPTGPWSIKVNWAESFVVVYRGGIPVKAFVCSAGAYGTRTPTGNFQIMDHLRWHELMGPSWGQYCSHITPSILFHSVPYNRPYDIYSMSSRGYNMLGQPASHGCIRLTVASAKYIYDNVPIGTPVYVGSDVPRPTNGVVIERPLNQPIPLSQTWDPTDPAIK